MAVQFGIRPWEMDDLTEPEFIAMRDQIAMKLADTPLPEGLVP